MKRAVCALINGGMDYEGNSLWLAIARNSTNTTFGLPGGKVEEGETCEEALLKELKEETGITGATELERVFEAVCKGEEDYLTTTFAVWEPRGKIESQEGEYEIRWVTWEMLVKNSPFGEYNKALYEAYYEENWDERTIF